MADEQPSSEAKQDEMILKQKEAIEKEIQASHKLVNEIEEVKVLETQFCNDPTFLKNAIQLQVRELCFSKLKKNHKIDL